MGPTKTANKGGKNRAIKLGIALLAVIVAFGAFYYQKQAYFNDAPPRITLLYPKKGTTYINPTKQVAVRIEDDLGLERYSVAIYEVGKGASTQNGGQNGTQNSGQNSTQNGGEKTLLYSFSRTLKDTKGLNVLLPTLKVADNTHLLYEISAHNISYDNLFRGATTSASYSFIADSNAPKISFIANSYAITRGGSALAIFRVEDSNIKDIVANDGKQDFVVYPYVKEGYYAIILPYFINNTSFAPTIRAQDLAYNTTIAPIPFYQNTKVSYKKSTIVLKDHFNTKLDEIVAAVGYNSISEDMAIRFREVNENIREKDELFIYDRARGKVSIENISDDPKKAYDSSVRGSEIALDELLADAKAPPSYLPFRPLLRSVVVGLFGDYRSYSYKDKVVSNAYHLGTDFASYKNSKVFLGNKGYVIFARHLGIYGNTVLVYNGFGLSSSYSHMSEPKVKAGEKLDANAIVGLTGTTGLAFGDHLHFGIWVQGVPVRDVEWEDRRWINTNINKVFAKAYDEIMAVDETSRSDASMASKDEGA